MRPTPWRDDARLTQPDEADRTSFGAAFERLVGVMARLRGADGCPWDQAQTLDSIKPYLIEETYEVIEAMSEGTVDDHKEELGDLLMQVVFHAELRREAGAFDAAEVAHGIADKLVRRHPHVFGGAEARGKAEAFGFWERKKAEEKGRTSVLQGVPRTMPALLRAQRITEKAGRVGFDWPDVTGPLAKLQEELGELQAAMATSDKAAIQDELGDVLFTLANLARFLDVDAESALDGTTAKFQRRFCWMESAVRARGTSMDALDLEALEALWLEAKDAV